jgi:hypothetical protein
MDLPDQSMAVETDPLMAKTQAALMRIPIFHLKVFCEHHNLTVCSTGKRGPIKKDYAAAIWIQVSDTIFVANPNADRQYPSNKDHQPLCLY